MKENNAKLKALLKLREMITDIIDEDFKANKMPKLMAVKVTKVEENPELGGEIEIESSDEMPEIVKDEVISEEPCEMCEKMPCECEGMESSEEEPESLQRLRKLLKK